METDHIRRSVDDGSLYSSGGVAVTMGRNAEGSCWQRMALPTGRNTDGWHQRRVALEVSLTSDGLHKKRALETIISHISHGLH